MSGKRPSSPFKNQPFKKSSDHEQDYQTNKNKTPTPPTRVISSPPKISPQTIYMSPTIHSNNNYSMNPSIVVSTINSQVQPYENNQNIITLNGSFREDDMYNDELPTQYNLSSINSLKQPSSLNNPVSNRSSINSNQQQQSNIIRLNSGGGNNSRPQTPPPPSYIEAMSHSPVSPITPQMNTINQGRKMYSNSWSEPLPNSFGNQPVLYHDVFVRKVDSEGLQRSSTPNLSKQPFDLYNNIVNMKDTMSSNDASSLRKEKDLLGFNKELLERSCQSSKNAVHPVEVLKEDLEKIDNEQVSLDRPEEEILYELYQMKNKMEVLRKELAAKQSRKSKMCWNFTHLGLDLFEILVTVLLVNFCVASFWRGTWVLIESYVSFEGTSPDRAAQINLIYFGIGVAVVGFFQLLSLLVRAGDLNKMLLKYWKGVRESFRDSDRVYHKMRPKLLGLFMLSFLWIVEKVHVYFVAVGCVFCWRGVFGIWDSYIAPYMDRENRILSGWLSHGIGLMIVLLFGVMNSLLVAPAKTTNDRMMSFSGFVASKWSFITNTIKESKKTNQERKILKECVRRDSVNNN